MSCRPNDCWIASAWGMRAPWLVAGAVEVAVAAVAARALRIDRV